MTFQREKKFILKIYNYYMQSDNIFIFLFFIYSFFFDGFKNEFYFAIASVLFLIYFYIKDLKISLSPEIFLPVICLFSIFNINTHGNEYFLFYKVFISVLFYFYFKNMDIDEKKDFLKFFFSFYVFFTFFILISFYYSIIFKNTFYFIGNNKNYIAFLSSGAFIVKYLDWRNKQKYIDLFLAVFFLFSLFFINSRSSYISVFLTLFTISKKKLRFILYSSVITLFLFIVLPTSFSVYVLKLNDPYSYLRTKIWYLAIRAFLEKPIFGQGIDFKYIFEKYKFPFYDGFNYYNHSTIHAHSEFLNILSEYGLIYFIIYLFMVIKSLKTKDEYIKNLIINFTVFSLFDITLKVPFFNILYFSILGLSANSCEKYLSFRKIFILSTVFSIFSFYSLNMKDSLSFENYEKILESDLSLSRKNSISIYFSSFYHFNPFLYYNSALYYYSIKDYDEAEKFLIKALKVEPEFNQAILMYCDIMIRKGNIELARLYFKKIKPHLCDTVYCYKTAYFDKNIYLSIKRLLNEEKIDSKKLK